MAEEGEELLMRFSLPAETFPWTARRHGHWNARTVKMADKAFSAGHQRAHPRAVSGLKLSICLFSSQRQLQLVDNYLGTVEEMSAGGFFCAIFVKD